MLKLSVEHKKHMQLLAELPINVFQSCCKLVNDFFHKGHNYKAYTTVAHKINIESENIKQCVDGLIHLLIECVKHEVASRSMLTQLEPIITIDLALKKNTDSDVSKHIIVQSDPTNIINLSRELEVALQEGRSQHMRKIQRIGKQI
ncbi:uncharacterized protein [Chelonus insularis]|uniref:uncharacterized protein n=1 Tax=Chelonus insularis TaxID=460826 RepID=UPI00158CDAF4|nr:uncharacterized protein LOC118066602 [Chelonus insularis]